MLENMRPVVAAFAVCVSALALGACGYMGDPHPPALNRPMRVEDLTAVERGSKIIVQFTIPTLTTENLPIKPADRDIELRIGPPPPGEFTMEKWLATSDRVPVPAAGKAALAHVEVPAMKYYNKTVDIFVNVHGPKGHSVGWSAAAIVDVLPEVPTPEKLSAKDAPNAVHLEWTAAAPEFRIFRKLVPEVNWTQIGTSDKPSYTDNTIEYGTTYQYMVQSIHKTADGYDESDLSDVTTIRPMDTFPPAVPTGLTAVPGARTIELVWDRNTEKDFAGYRVYRDGKQIADGLTAPTYSDRDVKTKVTYKYQVSAVDMFGNESGKSAVAEATIP